MKILKQLRLQHHLSQAALAQALGVHQTAISQWENGKTAPDMDSLQRLSEFFGVSVDHLLGKRERGGVKIAVLGYIRAGLPAEAIEDVIDYEEITPEMASRGEHFALSVRGESMLPRICPGDVVIVRKQADVDSGDVAVVLVDGRDATVKKVVKNGTGLTLVPFNPAFEPIVFSAEEMRTTPVTILGKVVELRGKF